MSGSSVSLSSLLSHFGERKGPVGAKRRWEGEGSFAKKNNNKNKTLIPTFSRKRGKECADVSPSHPLPLAGEGRVRVFFFFCPHPSTASRREREEGFTLIEMLVALAIFSLAALALLRLGGATATNSARLDDQAMAQIVARNIAVETLTDPEPPAFGAAGGVTIDGGRTWRWSRTVAHSPEARIQQIEIAVAPEAGGPGRASLIVFRRAPM
ncbi:MAG: type II secretion system minor pseudopilin GspI [Sphingomonadaceae bacterium]|nr:type II secretion system minor pseudopilin GspI [Sphingomonadaceae bacterium]